MLKIKYNEIKISLWGHYKSFLLLPLLLFFLFSQMEIFLIFIFWGGYVFYYLQHKLILYLGKHTLNEYYFKTFQERKLHCSMIKAHEVSIGTSLKHLTFKLSFPDFFFVYESSPIPSRPGISVGQKISASTTANHRDLTQNLLVQTPLRSWNSQFSLLDSVASDLRPNAPKIILSLVVKIILSLQW